MAMKENELSVAAAASGVDVVVAVAFKDLDDRFK